MATPHEKRIFRDLLSEDISLEDAQWALSDPASWKTQQRGMTYDGVPNGNWWRWAKVRTPRLTVCYCWYRHRNAAGYFVGWRETEDAKGITRRDQFVARRSKKRLAALQKRKTRDLQEKHPVAPRMARKPAVRLDPRIQSIEGERGDWFVRLLDGYSIGGGQCAFHLADRRSLSRYMKRVVADK